MALLDAQDCAAKSLEVCRSDTTEVLAAQYALQISSCCLDIFARFKPDFIFLWNGAQLVERVVAKLSPNIKKLFFEISNLPGKLFVDPVGVNAASSIATAPQAVQRFGTSSESQFQDWKKEYLDAKRKAGVPQAKAARRVPWERPADAMLAQFGYGVYPISVGRMCRRFIGKMSTGRQFTQLHNEFRQMTERAYRFFPLQVSEDTQLLLNSSLGNLAALRLAAIESSEGGNRLVVKIHPAENSTSALSNLRTELRQLRRQHDVVISSGNTNELISGAELVYTINSTVGLEAIILEKPVRILGKALYKPFAEDHALLRAYVLSYLVDIDYFENEAITKEQLAAVLERGGGQ
ncbi:MAG: hypothetical protein Aurels2KO_20870 [Aureliella sp.]